MAWSGKYKKLPYIIMEAAILFESGFHDLADYTILVTAPEEDRVSRVQKRDGLSISSIRNRMSKQYSDNEKEQMASLVLYNDNRHLLIPEIIKTDKNLREYGKIW
jgi:dephospho-CoA kinase